jgi:2,4-dienoyl-CoA reductase-like NADH-dependent reductase (Old Yellow Enzyme family)
MNTLFAESKIGTMTLSNRFVRSGTAMGFADNGEVTGALIEAYKNLAAGKVGLIITGFAFVGPKGQVLRAMLGFEDDRRIDGLTKLTDAVHSEGAKIVAQLAHGGSKRYFDAGVPLEGPSAIMDPMSQLTPEEMTIADIEACVADFSAAARRAVGAGFDGVQIHAAHGYLLSQFLAPYANKRTDQYGGGIENRARIILEIYRAVKRELGDSCPVLIKIDAKQYADEGLEWEEAKWVCRELDQLGIDAIELSAIGGPEFMEIFSDIDKPEREAYLKDFAKDLKATVSCPVIMCGGVRSLDLAETLYEQGTADFYSLARPLVTEPDLVSRWMNGNKKKSRCISCNKCLFTVLQGGETRCYQFVAI